MYYCAHVLSHLKNIFYFFIAIFLFAAAPAQHHLPLAGFSQRVTYYYTDTSAKHPLQIVIVIIIIFVVRSIYNCDFFFSLKNENNLATLSQRASFNGPIAGRLLLEAKRDEWPVQFSALAWPPDDDQRPS